MPGKLTLCVDIGGSGVKGLVVADNGKAITQRVRIETPRPATPDAVLAVIEEIAKRSAPFDRVAVGFPGVVKNGMTLSAPNLHEDWQGFDIDRTLEKRLKRPVRAGNDAAVQGLGAISGKGLEMVITLGTGLGCALYLQGRLAVPMEMAHHPFRKGKTYEECLGDEARERKGNKKWNERLQEAIANWESLIHYDRLFIGGGNAEHIDFELPANVKISSNQEGLYGGLGLWLERSV